MTEGPTGAPPPVEAEAPPEFEAGPPPEFEAEGRFSINEDWAATITGLALLLLVLAGVITGSMIGGFVPTLVTT